MSEKSIHNFKSLLNTWKECNSFHTKLSKAVRNGVPDCCRAQVWKKLINSEALQRSSSFSYKANVVAVREQLVDIGVSEYGGTHCLDVLCNMNCDSFDERVRHGQMNVKHIRQIMLDLDRSYPTHRQFSGNTQEAKEGRASLFRLLAVYARYNPSVGYCQGMGFIAGMLLMQMSEEEAFWCLVSLFERKKYLLGYFDNSLARIQTHAQVFQKMLQQRLPRLYSHFEKLTLHPLMYVTPWFMCLFTSLPCWDTVLSIWDKILLQGTWTIFPVALSILEIYEEELLTVKDLANLLPRLLHLKPAIVRHNFLVPHIWSCSLEKWEVDSIQTIVHDEQRTSSSGTRKRRRTDMKENAPTQPKRQKNLAAPAPENPSMFKKIINIFAQTFEETTEVPQSTNHTVASRSVTVSRKTPSSSTRYRRAKRAIRFNSPGSVQYTKMNSPGFSFLKSPQAPGLATPLRRSPRLAFQKWRNVNTPSDKRLVSRDAQVQHSFKLFHTPTPLRRSQRSAKNLMESPCQISLAPLQLTSPNCLSSPEIELRPMTRFRRSTSAVKIVL